MYHINEKALRLAMVREGIYSYNQLAKASGVSRATLSNLFRHSPTLRTIGMIGDALGLSSQELAEIFMSK